MSRPVNLVDKLRKQSVLLARDLVNYISDHELPEGTRLPTEQEMQQQFGVGRNTIREALRLLETRGVIRIRPGRGGGPVVRRPRSDDLGEALQLVLQFQGATLLDILDARALVEPLAASHAASARGEELIAGLQKTNDALLAAPDDELTFSDQNSRFHSIIGESMNLPVISVFLHSLKSVHDGLSYGVHYPANRVRDVARAHQKIVDAIKVGDSAAAEESMRRHLAEAKRYWMTNFPQTSAQPLRWLGD